MKIGARVIKTGLAVIVALYVSMAFGLQPPVFAAIAAVISIQPSVYRSLTTFVEQIKANIIGAAIALIVSLTIGNSPIVIGITVILIIAINLLLKYEKSISISVLMAIAIMESGNENFLEFALHRFALIIIGMLAATLINALFIPPKHHGKIKKLLEQTNDQLTLLMLDRSTTAYATQIEELHHQSKTLEELFDVYQEEVFFRKYDFQKKRELVTYKRLISVFKKELKLLQQIKRVKDEQLQAEVQTKIIKIVEIQRKLLHSTRMENKQLAVLYDFRQYSTSQLRLVSLLVDIEFEINKLLRYKQRRDRLQQVADPSSSTILP